MSMPLRVIPATQITQAVATLCVDAFTQVNPDIRAALEKMRTLETSIMAQTIIDRLLENAAIAERDKMPVCQDTGLAVVFVSIGAEVHVDGDIEAAINEGVRQGYRTGYGRNSVVLDPIRRSNTGDNTPAVIHYDFVPGDKLRLTVAPKGFGSENMSAIRLLKPADGLSGVEDFVVQTVQAAGPNPCPPMIVGVGVGGTMEKAALLAKRALLREVGRVHTDPFWAEAEARLMTRINALGIGPAGFGGHTTALGVHILTYPTHIAGLPVAVNIGCHVTRHQTSIL